MKRNHLLHLTASAIVLLGLCHCQAISSFQDSAKNEGPRAGITYYLPKTDYSVSVSVTNEFDDAKKLKSTTIAMGCTPVFVADTSAGAFTMHSSANEFFERDHQIHVADGLLSSVGITDNGRILEIMKKLGDTAALVIAAQINPLAGADSGAQEGTDEKSGEESLAAAGGGRADLDPEDDFPYEDLIKKLPPFPTLVTVPGQTGDIVPTKEETERILSEITPGDHQWYFDGSKKAYKMPGASGAVTVRFELVGADGGKGGVARSDGLEEIRKQNCGTIPGIVARNTTKAGVGIILEADQELVAGMRGSTAKKNVETLQDYIKDTTFIKDQFDTQYNALSAVLKNGGVRNNGIGNFGAADLAKLRKGRDQIDRARKGMEKDLGTAAGKLKLYSGLVTLYHEGKWAGTPIHLKTHMMEVRTTVDERAVVIPLTRGPVGETTHTVTLAEGVVTDWSFKKQSAAEGLIDIPIELAKDVVGIPAAVVQGQKNGLAAKKDLVDAQANLIKSRAELVKAEAALKKAEAGEEDDKEEDKEGDGEKTE